MRGKGKSKAPIETIVLDESEESASEATSAPVKKHKMDMNMIPRTRELRNGGFVLHVDVSEFKKNGHDHDSQDTGISERGVCSACRCALKKQIIHKKSKS